MTISKEFLAILACPQCRGEVIPDESRQGLICNPCRLFYRIDEGIPVMLIDEAQKLKSSQKAP